MPLDLFLFGLFALILGYLIYVSIAPRPRQSHRRHKPHPSHYFKYHMKKWLPYKSNEPWTKERGMTTHIFVPAKSRKHFAAIVKEMEERHKWEEYDEAVQRSIGFR